jgi:hypothetical protein
MSLLISMLVLASAAADPSAQVEVTAKAAKSEDKVNCKMVYSTGSRLRGNRVCMTRRQWNDLQKETTEQLEHAMERPTGTPK